MTSLNRVGLTSKWSSRENLKSLDFVGEGGLLSTRLFCLLVVLWSDVSDLLLRHMLFNVLPLFSLNLALKEGLPKWDWLPTSVTFRGCWIIIPISTRRRCPSSSLLTSVYLNQSLFSFHYLVLPWTVEKCKCRITGRALLFVYNARDWGSFDRVLLVRKSGKRKRKQVSRPKQINKVNSRVSGILP